MPHVRISARLPAPWLLCWTLALSACSVGQIDPGNSESAGNAEAGQAIVGAPIQLGANVPAVNLVEVGSDTATGQRRAVPNSSPWAASGT